MTELQLCILNYRPPALLIFFTPDLCDLCEF